MKKKLQKTSENGNGLSMRKIYYIFVLVFCFLFNNTILAQQPTLYGLTQGGGVNSYGALFGITTGSTSTSQVYSFAMPTVATGYYPAGSLIQASNGKLYGTAGSGGANNYGVIFEYDPSLSIYTLKYSFNNTLGSSPYGALLQASNGKLYGLAVAGGSASTGVLFEYDLSTSTYTKKIDFAGAIGENPNGSLIQGSNGKLYGMTYAGGSNTYGVIFEYDISTNGITVLYNFDSTHGRYPYGAVIQATNGKLYGMTSLGGTNGAGVIFEYNLSTSSYTNIFNFNGTSDGYDAEGNLIQASNGKLYGMTNTGGTYNYGVLFEYDLSISTYTKKIDFDTPIGIYPRGSLMQASNGKLYGMTQNGGASTAGTLFEYDYSTSTFTNKMDFNGTNGGGPVFGHLIEVLPCAVTGTITKSNVTCNGAANGSATITAGGVGPYTYSWSASAGTASAATGLSPGTYTVVITGAYSCTATKTVNITQPANLTATSSQTNATCFGGSNGVASVTPSGGTSPYTYSWTTSSSTLANASGLSAGNYTATIKDNKNCVITKTFAITQGTAVTISVNSGTICSGKTFTMSPSGVNTYTYQGGSASVSPTTSTNYTVQGSDALGCVSNIVTSSVTVNASPNVTITPSSTVICSANSVTLTAGGAASYLWSNNTTTFSTANPFITGPNANFTRTVTGTAANGCTNIAVQTISVNTSPTVNASTSAGTVCAGTSVTLTATGATTYTWNGVTTGSAYVINPTIAATYTVIGSTNACTDQSTVAVSILALPNVTITPSSTVSCSADNVTLTAGGALSYLWSNGTTTTTTWVISPNSNTTRTVVGTAANGCTNQAVQSISVNTTPTVTIVPSSTVVCSANTVTLTTNGASTYTWSNALGNATLVTVSSASNYTRTVTGAAVNGCTASASQTIVVNTTPTVTIVPSSTVVCSANTATLTTGGASTYTWSNALGNTTLVTVSSTSNYTRSVTGTAANGCTASASQGIVVNTTPTISIVPSSTAVCSANSTTFTTSGASTYTWSNALGNATLVTFSSPSNYTLSVTGTANSCTAFASQAIVVNTTPTVTIVPSTTVVCSANSVTLTTSGASTYTWSNALGNATLVTVSSASNYTRTVTGTAANGCIASASQSILVNTTPTVNIVPSSTAICSANSATFTTSGASTYTWSNSLGNATLVTFSSASNYTLNVTGTANSCTASASQAIVVNTTPTLTIVPSSTVVCSANTVTLTVNGASTYTWSNALGNATLVTVSSTGNYTRTVIGTANGCTNQAVQSISVNTTPTITIVPTSTLLCSGNGATLTANGAGTYTWQASGPTSSVNTVAPLSNTTYTVVGTSSLSSCTNTAVITVSVNPMPTITINPSNTVICSGLTVSLTATGATTYSWTNGPTTNAYTLIPASSSAYSVTGQTAGCFATASSSVTVNQSPTVTVNSGTICTGNSFTMIASGANTYSWSTGSTASNLVVTPPGTTVYVVTGTATNNCSGTATANVVVGNNLVVTIVPSSNSVCAGNSVTLTASGANSYTWSNTFTSTSIVDNPALATTYSVLGSSGPSCTNTASQLISILPSPTLNITGNNFICLGLSTVLNASGANTYTWSTGPTTSSVLVTPAATTIYTVSGSNSFNCVNSATYQVQTTALVTPSLCLVTVDSLSINNEIYWEKSDYQQADSFIVYRESSASFYSVIARLSKNDPGFYTDTNRSIGPNNGNPNYTSYKYKFQYRDTCGNLSPLSDYHKTIFITDYQTGNFSWNYYNIGGVDQQTINYVLYRRNVLSGVTTSVGGTSGTAFTDPQYSSLAAAGNVKWFVGMSGFACDPNQRTSSTTQATVSTTKSNNSNEKQFPVVTEGIEKNSVSERNISIYPNPAENRLNVDFGNKYLKGSFDIKDITGRLVIKSEINGSQLVIPISDLTNGIYFLILYEGNRKLTTQKIIVQRP